MTLIGLILGIALLGFVVWAITALIPMPEHFKRVIYIISLVVLVLYLMSVFGVLGAIPNPRLTH